MHDGIASEVQDDVIRTLRDANFIDIETISATHAREMRQI